jgi:hypothetical protein
MRRLDILHSAFVWGFAALALLAGCDSASRDAFREAAGDDFETAVNDILQGVAEGVFEVVDPSPGSQTRP